LISLSPLRKAPPKLLQQLPVRTSNGVAPAFLLSFPSSPGFGSIAGERRPVRTTLSLCLRLTAEASPPHDHLHVHYTKGTRERRSALRVCSSSNFTGGCAPPTSIPSRYLFTIDHRSDAGPWNEIVPSSCPPSLEGPTVGPSTPSPPTAPHVPLRWIVSFGGVGRGGQRCAAEPLSRPSPCHRPSERDVTLRLFRVRSPLLTDLSVDVRPRGTEMFQFPPSSRRGLSEESVRRTLGLRRSEARVGFPCAGTERSWGL